MSAPMIKFPPARQHGSVMIEALVSIVVTSLALMASAALTLNAAKVNQNGRLRAQAVVLVNDIVERIDANVPAASTRAYELAAGVVPSSGSTCDGSDCTADQLAAADLAGWHARITTALPGATTQLAFTPAAGTTPASYAITVNWVERSSGHGGTARKNDGSVTASTENFSYTTVKAVPQR